jgi:hypothetical protein
MKILFFILSSNSKMFDDFDSTMHNDFNLFNKK